MRKSTVFILALALSLSVSVLANKAQFRVDHPQSYVVQKGDTLWGISSRFLKNPWMWPSVWYANPQVKNPHLIYPGDKITLVYVDGKPQLRIDRGRPVVKLTPRGRVLPFRRPVPTIPVHLIRPFLSKPRIISREDFKKAPYIVHAYGERLMVGAGDRVYVRGHKQYHRNYVVVREGSEYRDPVTKEVLGFEAKYIGDSILQKEGDPATHYLSTTTREVLIGDRLLPVVQNNNRAISPVVPEKKISGQIISVLDGVSQIGQHQIVVINRGTREGIKVGHVLAVYKKGKTIRDTIGGGKTAVKLPDERAGILLVFSTHEKMSYALVMSAERNMKILDMIRNP